jgi:hypothetical protein
VTFRQIATIGVLLVACEDRVPDYRRDAGRVFVPDAARRDAGPEIDAGPRPDGGLFTRGIELRCEQLGDACRCSEPLDTNAWGLIDLEWADPVDSPDDTECRGDISEGSVWYPRLGLEALAETGMPAANVVEFVWSNTLPDAESYIVGDWPSREESKRLCARVYVRTSGDYQSAGQAACTDAANMELAFRNDSEMMIPRSRVRMYESGGTFHVEALDFGATPRVEVPSGGEALGPRDCTGWCRMEMCLAGELEAGTGITASAYVRTLGGREMTWSSAVGNAGVGRVRIVRIADMTRLGGCAGERSYSHAIHAEWPLDEAQQIGAAVEVEGP